MHEFYINLYIVDFFFRKQTVLDQQRSGLHRGSSFGCLLLRLPSCLHCQAVQAEEASTKVAQQLWVPSTPIYPV